MQCKIGRPMVAFTKTYQQKYFVMGQKKSAAKEFIATFSTAEAARVCASKLLKFGWRVSGGEVN